jgi:hypothetical protein
MDAKMAREQLRELNDQIKALDDEREVLLSLINGYNGWLRLHGESPPEPRKAVQRSNVPAGDVSLRSAVLTVLKQAHGSPVHVREILARITTMGAVTRAKSPEKVIDLVAYNLKTRKGEPLERVSPRSWRYVGSINGDGR